MIYYIYTQDAQKFIKEQQEFLKKYEIAYLPFEELGNLDISIATHLVVTGCLQEIKQVMGIAHQANVSLGIVPLVEQKELRRTFDLPAEGEAALEQAFGVNEKCIDLLYCNGELVLQEVVVGDAPPLDQFDTSLKSKTYWDRIKMFWRTIKKVNTLKHMTLQILDAKENEITVSAVGLVGIAYNNNTFAAKLIPKQLSTHDGRLSMVLLSPSSILQYMGYLFQSLVFHLRFKHFPSSVGYVRSATFKVQTEKPVSVRIDSSSTQQTPIVLEVEAKALALNVGAKFWTKKTQNTPNKDSMKISHLPSDEERMKYLSTGIPLFSHASQSQYASLFSNLREESILSQQFTILLILATMIATFGLFINSSSVIIGAMLLAPLMQPIVSLSMGVLRQDISLQINGAKTIMWGVFFVLLTSATIAIFTPIEVLTSEMKGRLSPTILDLFVAMVSGIAAAYAKSNEKIVGSLAGVAIAVALVPPIAVAGIGLGWGDWSMFFIAFLLFITNLVGIVFAGAFTFVLLGFSPLHLAKKGIMIWLLIIFLVSIPLYQSFSRMKEDISIQTMLSELQLDLGQHQVVLSDIQILHVKDKEEIYCEVISSGLLTQGEKQRLKKYIALILNKEVKIIVSFRYKL